jgi:hypothetical protein
MTITRDDLTEALRVHADAIKEADEWRPLVDHVLALMDIEKERILAEIETRKHQRRVAAILHLFVEKLLDRADIHDDSKTTEPEVNVFAKFTAKLKGVTYGSPEYKDYLGQMKPALDHHYAKNRHHPEHYPEGVNDMTLVDLVEMLADWKSASERHDDGNILQSIEKNRKRFNIDAQLAEVLVNTVKFLSLVEQS